MATVKEFITQSYRLISASSPTQPLHGNDLSQGVEILNQLLESYASTGLLLTIAKTEQTTIVNGQQNVICADADFLPAPDITAGRLANLNSAWLILNNVTYPLIQKSRDEFLASFKYEPLAGLPRFIFLFQQTDYSDLRLYPAPSQNYELYIRGKFQLSTLTPTDTMDALPAYYYRFALLSVARDLALYKGRSEAWTPQLEQRYMEARDLMESASEVNLTITGETASLLNGSWRVRSGV